MLLNEYLIGCLFLFGIWIILYFSDKDKKGKRELVFVSFLTSFFGLTQPLFVPEYWSPPSLFNLNLTTGFDIESLIFAFSVGGIASVLYEIIFKNKHEIKKIKHYHLIYLLFIVLFFFGLVLFFPNLNPIYSAIIAMTLLGIISLICRPDLKNKIVISGFLFLIFYFLYHLILFILILLRKSITLKI